jgi:hypothetical protein
MSFGSGSGRVSDHLISSNLGFQVISGRIGSGQVLFCDVLLRVGFFFVIFYFESGRILGRIGFRVVKRFLIIKLY